MQSMFLWEEPPANPTVSQDSGKDWMIRVASSCLPMWRLLGDTVPNFAYGKMSPASFRVTRDETLEAFWDCSQGSTSNAPQEDGKTAESYRATRTLTASHGECLTLSISEWNHTLVPFPNDDGVCLLSDILETGDVPQRYYLSVRACRGILHRAAKRGRALPRLLLMALEHVVQTITKVKQGI